VKESNQYDSNDDEGIKKRRKKIIIKRITILQMKILKIQILMKKNQKKVRG